MIRMEPEEKKDIFSGTKLQSHDEKQHKEHEASFSKGLFNLLEGFGHIFKGIKFILFKRFYMNVFLLLVVIGASVGVTYYAQKSLGQDAVTVVFPEDVDLSSFQKSDIAGLLCKRFIGG